MNMIFPTEFDRSPARFAPREPKASEPSGSKKPQKAFADQLSSCCKDQKGVAKSKTDAKGETKQKSKAENSQTSEKPSAEDCPDKEIKTDEESEKENGTKKAVHKEMALTHIVLNFPRHSLASAGSSESPPNLSPVSGDKGKEKGASTQVEQKDQKTSTGRTPQKNKGESANIAHSKSEGKEKEALRSRTQNEPRVSAGETTPKSKGQRSNSAPSNGSFSPNAPTTREAASESTATTVRRIVVPPSGDKPTASSQIRLNRSATSEAETANTRHPKDFNRQPKMPRATPASSPGPSNEARSATANSAVVPSVHVAAPTATPNLAPLNLSSAEAEAPRNTTQTTMQSSGSFGQSSGEGDRHRGDSHQSSTLLGNISGRMDGAASQKAENIRVFISQLDSALQTMNQEKSSNIKLRISLERGEVIRIQLSLRGSKLKTSIHTESDNVRQLLRSSWSEVSRALSAKGVEAEMPEFDGGSENSSHREKSFAERTEAELAQLQRNGRTSDSAQDSPNKPNELRDSRIFSRIA